MNLLYDDLKAKIKTAGEVIKPDENVMKKINGLKTNGPLVKLKGEDVIVRGMICIGEEATSHMSIHPEPILKQIAKLFPGAPMMEGHKKNEIPWGRVYDAEVVEGGKGYEGKVVQIYYYFMNDEDGQKRAKNIDGGILGEASISYWFGLPYCNICNKPFYYYQKQEEEDKKIPKTCQEHVIGKKYDGKICYWYPKPIESIGECSLVYRGAYEKTKGIIDFIMAENEKDATEEYEENKIEGAKALCEALKKGGGYVPKEQEKGKTGDNGESGDTGSGNNEKARGADEGGNNEPRENNENGDARPKENKENRHGNENNSSEQSEGGEQEGANSSEGNGRTEKEGNEINEEEKNRIEEIGRECNIDGSEKEDAIIEVLYETRNNVNDELLQKALAIAEFVNRKKVSEQYPDESSKEKKVIYCDVCFPTGKEVADSYDATICECGKELFIENPTKIDNVIGSIKPAKNESANNEYFKKDGFSDLPDGRYYVEPKYDGIYIEAHKANGNVKLYTDEGNEITEKFPTIVNELKETKQEAFIVAGEIVKYIGRKRGTNLDVTNFINKKEKGDDKPFRYKTYDMILLNKESLRKKGYDIRRKMLEGNINYGEKVHHTAGKWVEHEKGNTKIVKIIDDRKTREGTMIKNAGMTYNKNGRKLIYKWKRQHEIDCKVDKIKTTKNENYVYVCSVEGETMGDTYATSIKAAVGNIISVAVDRISYNENNKKYRWTAPKVTRRRNDKKKTDPITTVRKLTQLTITNGTIITLTEVYPKLCKLKKNYELYIVGGVVENGVSTHDLDLLTKQDLNEEQKLDIREALGDEIGSLTEYIVDKEGPRGTHIEIPKSKEEKNAWKYAKKFVIQEHGWGDKRHYDIRFGAPKTARMWGYTCFSKPTIESGGKKSRCHEKKYHDQKWMDIDTKKIKPGEPGNPTKNLNAWMSKIDEGEYQFVQRKKGFLEVILKGNKYKGRYLFREVEVKTDKEYIDGDEVKAKDEKIWIVWKPKDQEKNGEVERAIYTRYRGQLCISFSDCGRAEIDRLNAMEDESIESENLEFEVM